MNTRKRNKLKAKRTPFNQSKFHIRKMNELAMCEFMLKEFEDTLAKARSLAVDRIIEQKFKSP